MFTNSLFLKLLDRGLQSVQNSRAVSFIRDSLIFSNLDNLIWSVFILTILSTAFLSSGVIGAFALLFSALNFFKILFKKGENIKISGIDTILIIWFLIVIVSLMGSSLFVLSFKGFLKNIVYILFYFSSTKFFFDNKGKILPTLAIVGLIMSYESVVAIFQHFDRVEALAGWVDTSKMTSEKELISRSFGTLNPSNPNLLGGYLIAGLAPVFAFLLMKFRNRALLALFGGIFLLNLIAIIFTGCRGAYIGLVGFFGVLALFAHFYIKIYLGGYSNIKKRYKTTAVWILVLAISAIALTPSISRRFTSIFNFRGDSSISFRMNVYEAAFNMFLDNPFLGIGLGNLNFREIYGLYMKTGFDALGAYCVPLEAAVESGIFALVALAAFITGCVVCAVKILKTSNEGRTKILMLSIILTIAATMAHGLFDTVWYRPQVQIIFWLQIGILNSFILKNNCNSCKNSL